MRRAVVLCAAVGVYAVASTVAYVFGERFLTAPREWGGPFITTIVAGPIGILEFSSLGPSSSYWAVTNLHYYLAVPAALAICMLLWYRTRGHTPRIALGTMILVWIGCSGYVYKSITWAV